MNYISSQPGNDIHIFIHKYGFIIHKYGFIIHKYGFIIHKYGFIISCVVHNYDLKNFTQIFAFIVYYVVHEVLKNLLQFSILCHS